MWKKIARFVAGESSIPERDEVLAWAAEDATHRDALESSSRAWEVAGQAAQRWDTATAWKSVQERMDASQAPRPRARPMMRALYGPSPRPVRPGVSFGADRRSWAIAAVITTILVGGSAGLAFWAGGQRAQDRVAVAELITRKGERVEIRLSDGTRVTLAPESRLHVASSNDRAIREVRLVGEAYFDVASDPGRPFVVVAGGTVTRVLGTEFDVRAYPSDSSVQVVVADGRVAFRPNTREEANATILQPGERGTLAAGSDKVALSTVDLDAYLVWQNGRLAFEDAPLSQVAMQLERWYGTPVRIGESSLRNRRLTASFRDQPVDEVVAVIAASLGLDYVRVGQVYTFFPKNQLGALVRS